MQGHHRLIIAALAGIAVCALHPAAVRAESNVMTCSLSRTGDTYQGSCEVPCLVNNLSIDIDGPKAGASCDAPERHDPVSLKPNGESGQWLGIMDGKFPEDPKRFEVIVGRNQGDGVAKTPFGWFAIRTATHQADAFNLTIAANNQLPPTASDIKIIERALNLLSGDATWNSAGYPQMSSGSESLEPILRLAAGNDRDIRRRTLPATRAAGRARGSRSRLRQGQQASPDGIQQQPGHVAWRRARCATCGGRSSQATPALNCADDRENWISRKRTSDSQDRSSATLTRRRRGHHEH